MGSRVTLHFREGSARIKQKILRLGEMGYNKSGERETQGKSIYMCAVAIFSALLDVVYTFLDILIDMEISSVKCKVGNAPWALNIQLIRFFRALSLHETSTCFTKVD